jgi:LPXTG-motif cell wall-anchored protein
MIHERLLAAVSEAFHIFIPKFGYTTDNAAMIAITGYYKFLDKDFCTIDKVDATHDKEGNIEYWYCEECGKYFGDKDGTKEIQKADTITDKLKDTPSDDKKDSSKPDKTKGDSSEIKADSSTADKPKSEQKNPQTGSGSGMSLWLAMLLISGSAAMGIKKKHKK